MNPPRRHFTKQRRQLSFAQRRQFAKQAARQLNKLQRRYSSRLASNASSKIKVGIYYDGFGELPTQPIVDWCHRLGYAVYLPVVGTLTSDDNRLRFSPINSTKLKAVKTHVHSLGMRQHRHHTKLWAHQLDIIFCPLVAVDNTGTRMGMGGGYYDRTLAYADKHNLKRPLKVGWCYDFQLISKTDNKDNQQLLERQPWDVALDAVVTPTRLLWFDKHSNSSKDTVTVSDDNLSDDNLSSADAVERHLQQLADSNIDTDTNDLQALEERELTGIVNDKRLAQLLASCDEFISAFDVSEFAAFSDVVECSDVKND